MPHYLLHFIAFDCAASSIVYFCQTFHPIIFQLSCVARLQEFFPTGLQNQQWGRLYA